MLPIWWDFKRDWGNVYTHPMTTSLHIITSDSGATNFHTFRKYLLANFKGTWLWIMLHFLFPFLILLIKVFDGENLSLVDLGNISLIAQRATKYSNYKRYSNTFFTWNVWSLSVLSKCSWLKKSLSINYNVNLFSTILEVLYVVFYDLKILLKQQPCFMIKIPMIPKCENLFRTPLGFLSINVPCFIPFTQYFSLVLLVTNNWICSIRNVIFHKGQITVIAEVTFSII